MNKNKQLAWKLVRTAYYGESAPKGSLVSMCASQDLVRYIKNRWTYPRDNAEHKFLFVMATRKSARELLRRNPGTELWRCEVINPTTKRAGQVDPSRGSFVFDVEKEWDYWPAGTRFVDAVKLLYRAH